MAAEAVTQAAAWPELRLLVSFAVVMITASLLLFEFGGCARKLGTKQIRLGSQTAGALHHGSALDRC